MDGSGGAGDRPTGAGSEAGRPGEPGSLASSAVRASAWVIGGYAVGQVLRLIGNVILARLLFPDVFGLSALVFVFLQGLQMFSDVGTGPAIVQSPRGDDRRLLDTAWTIASARGLLLWIGSWLIAQPVASFYGQPLLAQLLPVAGLNAALSGLESTALHTAQRHLRTERLTMVELASQVAGLVANIALALVYRSLYGAEHLAAVWAVIGGSLVGSVVRLVLSHTVFPGQRNRFRLDPTARRELFGFGRWVFVSTLLTFLSGQSDRLLLGKMIPLDLLGVYGIAANLAMLATTGIHKLGNVVLFPAYSRISDRGDLSQAFRSARLPLLVGGAAVVSGFLACGPYLIRVLYDERYVQAGWMLQYLAASAWFQILEIANSSALLARGRVSYMAANSAAKLIALVVLLPLGLHLGGFHGALAGLVLSDVVKYATSAVGTARQGMPGLWQDLALSAAIVGVSAVGLAAGSAAGHALHANVAGLLAAALVVGVPTGGAGLWYLRRVQALRARAAGPARMAERPGLSWDGSRTPPPWQ